MPQVRACDAMKRFVQYYHMEVVSRLAEFTSSERITTLGAEDILRLLEFLNVRRASDPPHGLCVHIQSSALVRARLTPAMCVLVRGAVDAGSMTLSWGTNRRTPAPSLASST